MFKYIRGWDDPKKLIPKPLRGSKLPLIWRFIEFLKSKKFACKISPFVASKLYFFWKMYLSLFRQDIKKISLLIAFQQSLSSGQKTSDFRRYWQILVKKLLPLHRRQFKSFFVYFFALIFFTLALATIFVSARFLPKVSKVKERGWK